MWTACLTNTDIFTYQCMLDSEKVANSLFVWNFCSPFTHQKLPHFLRNLFCLQILISFWHISASLPSQYSFTRTYFDTHLHHMRKSIKPSPKLTVYFQFDYHNINKLLTIHHYYHCNITTSNMVTGSTNWTSSQPNNHNHQFKQQRLVTTIIYSNSSAHQLEPKLNH